ncbi:MAG: TetR family transcriptional regulator [Desulfobulbaceae bacterium]|jgi:TetR/AcrR family fatty acid metabolism transcriptional regulator|nr:TetR family transcriptional regulator [Desulfobulbaceae bacterium]
MKTADKHAKIIRAATKVFAKKGFFNARISDIAKEAKVADGTIYLYFNNKYDMLLSVFEEKIGKLVELINSQLEKEEDPRRMLELFIANHLREMKKNRNLAEVIQIELRQTNKMVKDYRNNKFSEYLNIISTIIKEGQKQKVFRQDILPGIAKRALFGALDEIARIWNINIDSDYQIDEIENQVIKIFLVGVLETSGA